MNMMHALLFSFALGSVAVLACSMCRTSDGDQLHAESDTWPSLLSLVVFAAVLKPTRFSKLPCHFRILCYGISLQS